METTRFNKETVKNATLNSVWLPMTYAHHYEIFPYTYNSIVYNDEGDVISKQSMERESSKHKVIYNGNVTIVILDDGSKGVAKKNPSDVYDKQTGYAIAKMRANIKKLQKEIRELTKGV